MQRFLTEFKAGIRERLKLLYDAFTEWNEADYPSGNSTTGDLLECSFDRGAPRLSDEDAVRLALLEKAGCTIVPLALSATVRIKAGFGSV